MNEAATNAPVSDFATSAQAYPDGFAHIIDHLRLLDRRIERLVGVLRRSWRQRSGLDARNHVYISSEEVDRTLAAGILTGGDHSNGADAAHDTAIAAHNTAIAARVAASAAEGVDLPLEVLGQIFGLTPFERDAVVICLAPEIDRRYDRLYAYLQDDATRKRPSIDLILRLLCDSAAAAWRARTHFAPDRALLRRGLLRTVDDGYHPSGATDLACFLRLDDRIRWFLQGYDTVDDTVSDAVTVVRPTGGLDTVLAEPPTKAHLRALVDGHLNRPGQPRRLMLGLHGPTGVGRRKLAEGVCADLGCPLTVVNTARWIEREREVPALLLVAFRESQLHQGAIYLDGVDALVRSDARQAGSILATLGQIAAECGRLTFVAIEEVLRIDDLPDGLRYKILQVPRPGAPLREAAWMRALAQVLPEPEPAWARRLATAFTLTPRQIGAAADESKMAVVAREGRPALGLGDLFAACRGQCRHELGDLAMKILPGRSWPDLILPEPQLDQLYELCAQVRHRARVLDEWGLERVMSRARGVSALLAGAPGTGKTMAAEVIAGELGVDLFAVDLSGVISKYIGETEKNLSKIFQAAENSNVVLFFDEADALFGKRTEVSDAHDRYANIETSFLLQKLEQYDGVVLLATNLQENIDEAFTRRLRFIVDFPFPDEVGRALMWRTHLPAADRIAADVDVDLIARQYPLSGAGIRNAALSAAFAAAEDSAAHGDGTGQRHDVIALRHVRHGIRREYEKIGKLWTEPIPQWRTPSGRE